MQFETLKDILIDWREKNSEKSWSWLAKRAGVNPSTVIRVAEGEVGTPTYGTCKAICLETLQFAEAEKFLKAAFPQKTRQIEADLKSFEKYESSTMDVLEDIYEDYYKWHIFWLASTQTTTRNAICSLGPIYKNRLSDMITEKLVTVKNDIVVACFDPGVNANPKLSLKMLKYQQRLLQERIDRDVVDQDGILATLVYNVNVEGKSQIRDLVLEFAHKVIDIGKDQKFKGDQPITVSALISDFD